MASYSISHEYDAVGNRTRTVDNLSGSVTTFTYDAANQLVTATDSSGVTTYTYDQRGRRTRKDAPAELIDYTWSGDDRLTQVDTPSDTVEMTYDADGRRLKKANGAETKKYLYDFEKLLQETDGAGDSQYTYTQTVEEYGDLISQYDETAGSASYYGYDAQANAEALLDEDQDPSDRYAYHAFGQIESHTGGSQQPFTYAGRLGYHRDQELDLYFVRQRYYDPETIQWLTPDPLGHASDDDNLYRYVRNNPVNATDPSGMQQRFSVRRFLGDEDAYTQLRSEAEQEYGNVDVGMAVYTARLKRLAMFIGTHRETWDEVVRQFGPATVQMAVELYLEGWAFVPWSDWESKDDAGFSYAYQELKYPTHYKRVRWRIARIHWLPYTHEDRGKALGDGINKLYYSGKFIALKGAKKTTAGSRPSYFSGNTADEELKRLRHIIVEEAADIGKRGIKEVLYGGAFTVGAGLVVYVGGRAVRLVSRAIKNWRYRRDRTRYYLDKFRGRHKSGEQIQREIQQLVAPEKARFIATESGRILDTTKIRIPGPRNSPYGKTDYLLGRVPGNADSIGKGGFFKGVMGFDDATLDAALRRHLIDNFSSSTLRGNRIQVVGKVVGPSGRTASVKTVWQVLDDGSVDLITAHPF